MMAIAKSILGYSSFKCVVWGANVPYGCVTQFVVFSYGYFPINREGVYVVVSISNAKKEIYTALKGHTI